MQSCKAPYLKALRGVLFIFPLLFATLFIGVHSYAQQGRVRAAGTPKGVIAGARYNFTVYGVKEGLSQSQVYKIIQDRRGALWLATNGGGVTVYDGHSFTHLNQKNGLASNTVYTIIEDKDGNLWFGTDGGVTKYDGEKFIQITENDGLASNAVISIFEDKKGNLWFGTLGDGVTRFDGKKYTTITEADGLTNNRVYTIVEDWIGNIWFGTGSGATKYNGNSFTKYTNTQGLTNNVVYAIKQDRTGVFWFGTTNDGLVKYNGKSFIHYTEKDGLANNTVRTIVQDRIGNFWLGTNVGASKFDGSHFTNFTEAEGLSNSQILSLYEDRGGELWLGTGVGLNKYDGGLSSYDEPVFTHFSQKEGLFNSSVWAVHEDKKGRLWLGTDEGVVMYDGKKFYHYSDKEGFSSGVTKCIKEDRKGNLWFAVDDEGVVRFDGRTFTHFSDKDGLCNNRVFSIFEDKQGTIWFGNYGAITKYDGKKFEKVNNVKALEDNRVLAINQDKVGNIWIATSGSLVKYTGKSYSDVTQIAGLLNNSVSSITLDNANNVWIGSSSGVVKFDGKNYVHFTEKEGLIDNQVLSLVRDVSGNIWAGTNKGISCLFSLEKEKRFSWLPKAEVGGKLGGYYAYEGYGIRNYGEPEGFKGIECNEGAAYLDHRGDLWFGTADMLTRFNPKAERVNTHQPYTHINKIKLFYEDFKVRLKDTVYSKGIKYDSLNKFYYLPTDLVLPHNRNYLTFEFIGTSFKIPQKVRYRYMMEGFDEQWSPITEKTEATYSWLPPGEYSFIVEACNDEGVWNTVPFKYSFVILPPWYQTWWARTLFALVIIGGVVGYVRWRTASFKERQRELEQTVAERTIEIKEQKEEVERQSQIVQDKNRDILDSIRYAKRIQQALLTSDNYLNKHFRNHFVYYKPKDIVSGDFYWALNLSDKIQDKNGVLLAVGDCTGHGVPGAFMSILGMNFLDLITTEKRITVPSEVLNELRKDIITVLDTDRYEEGTEGQKVNMKDGMDMGLCHFDFENMKLSVAAAMNPVWVARNNGTKELIELSGDRFPVGKYYSDENKPFALKTIDLMKGDMVFLLTDGFADQFGGEQGKKFKYKPLREMLLSNSDKSMVEQKFALHKTFEAWKGIHEQVDDVCIIGIQI